jgi:hypothetical protein
MRDFTNSEATVFIVVVFLICSFLYSLLFKGTIEIFIKKYSKIDLIQIFFSCLAGEILGALISIMIFKINPPPSISNGQVGLEESIQQGIDQVLFCLILIIVLGVLSSLFYVFGQKTKLT